MIDSLLRAAEKRFGIKADPDDAEKLKEHILKTYGAEEADGMYAARFAAILERVFSSGEAADFLTVGETYFFREPAHFTMLRDLLPSFERTGIRICCAAVASGCEAYSIAMLIESYNRGAENPLLYQIDAFDINPRVIETARRGGLYSTRTLREDGSSFRYLADPYLEKTGEPAGYMVDSSLQKNINFFVHNLMDELPSAYDIIFFRNALIYFLPGSRERLFSNLSGALRKDGILLMGVSETAGVRHDSLESKDRNNVFYFQKRDCDINRRNNDFIQA
jgi:chemotaxis protein methyltransferase CheR